jgi:hypothetical protein
MSDRFRRSSTKYGPSVRAGVTTHDALVDDVEGEGEVGEPEYSLLHPRTPTATKEPRNVRASRRFMPDRSSDLSTIASVRFVTVLPRFFHHSRRALAIAERPARRVPRES